MVPHDARDDPNSGQVDELANLGRELRRRRVELGLTLEKVASAAGLTRGFLSQVELGGSSVSLEALLRICQVLGITLSELFQPSVDAQPVRKADRHPMYLGGTGVIDHILTSGRERRLQVLETHIGPGGSPSRGSKYHLDSEVIFMLVLKGRIEVRVQGKDPVVLHAGDSWQWSPATPYSWRNPSQKRGAVVLCVLSPAVF